MRTRLDREESRRRIEAQLRRRSEHFLAILERAVYGAPRSPYRPLLEHAGIELGDVVAMVRDAGLEGALERLYEAGVHLRHQEFKGRATIERAGLRFRARHEDFDNPMVERAFRARTGGSRGVSSRASVDLDLLAHDAAHNGFFDGAFGLGDRPYGQWRPVPPAYAAMNIALRACKMGHPVEHWFSHNWFPIRPDGAKLALLTGYVVGVSRLVGNPVPMPEHVPLGEVGRVAEWLAGKVRAGTPALFDCPATSAVRICLAAREAGLEIRGTHFRVGGEPYTPEKAKVVEEAGCTGVVRYSLTELGNIGMPCVNPVAPDSVHLLTDKIAVLGREVPGAADGGATRSLVVTTLLPASPKIMLNVDIDDYGVMGERDCGCPLYELGLRLQLHGIRSREKLTSEGMTFSGDRVLRLVDELLPARFGGHAADYQLVEVEEGGLPRVEIVVSPRVGPLDEGELAAAVLAELGSHNAAWRMAAEQWREGGTLRVVRREPHATGAGKVLPLHVAPRP